MNAPLARVEEARRLLVEANTVDEVKDIRDMAEQARLYAKQKGLSIEAMNQAAELKVRAERRMGELLAVMPKNQGGWESRDSQKELQDDDPPRLRDIGITPKQSMNYQRLADVPASVFEQAVEAVKDEERPISTGAVLRKSNEPTVADGLASGLVDWSKLPSTEKPPEEKFASRLWDVAYGIRRYTPEQIADASGDVKASAWQEYEALAQWIDRYAGALRERHEGPIRSVK